MACLSPTSVSPIVNEGGSAHTTGVSRPSAAVNPDHHGSTASAGDIHTNCAIVGGIVARAVGRAGIPPEWLTAREPIPFQRLDQ